MTLERPEAVRVWWAWAPKLLIPWLMLIPRPAISAAAQKSWLRARVTAAVLGLGVAVLGERARWVMIGAALGGTAALLPWLSARKSRMQRRLEQWAGPRTRFVGRPALLRFDGQRLVVEEGRATDERRSYRKLRVDESGFSEHEGSFAGATMRGLLPPNQRKAESVWLWCPERSSEAEPVPEERFDHRVRVDAAGFEALQQALEQARPKVVARVRESKPKADLLEQSAREMRRRATRRR